MNCLLPHVILIILIIVEDNDNLIWTAHDYLDLQTKKIPSALVNILVALYIVQYAVTLTKYFVQLAVALLQTILRRLAVALTHCTTRRCADNTCQTDNFVQLAHTKHLASRHNFVLHAFGLNHCPQDKTVPLSKVKCD